MKPSRHALFPLLLVLALTFAFPPPEAPAQARSVYHGNVRSRIFHRQSCRWFDCKACTAVFRSIQEAVAAGYRGCKVCKP